MGKEIKIGLAVVVVLLGVLGFVIYKKFAGPPVYDIGGSDLAEALTESSQPKLSSGPTQPTVLPASAAVKSPTSASTPLAVAPATTNRVSAASSRTSGQSIQPPENQAPKASYLPEANTASTTNSRSGDSHAERYGQPDRYQLAEPAEREAANSPDKAPESTSAASSYRRERSRGEDRYASPYSNYDLYGEKNKEPAGPSNPFRDVPQAAEEVAKGQPAPLPERIEENDAELYDGTDRNSSSTRRHRVVVEDDVTQSERRDRSPATRQPPPPVSPYANPQAYDVYGRNTNPQPVPQPAPTTSPRRQVVEHSRVQQPQRSATATIPASPGHERVAGDQYVVQPNDNYWEISRKLYGTGDFFKALFEHNRAQFPRPDQLRPGAVITCPSVAALVQTYPDLCPSPRQQEASQRIARTVSGRSRIGLSGPVYMVEQGDTLFDIARVKLGKASRWAEIYELNRELLGNDIDLLKPGMELVLPMDGQRDDPVAQQPSDARLR